MKFLYILLAYLLIAAPFPVVYGQSISKEKRVSGRFAAARGKLVIDNRYGKLDVNTWDKNEVTVDITITARANNAGDAQEILDRISIAEPGNSGNGIYYKTEIGKVGTSKSESGFSINYVVHMPRNHTAELTNKYGDIEMESTDGKLSIDLKYGNLKIGNLGGSNSDIKVAYGKADITSIESGNVRSSYSTLTIGKAGTVQIFNEFEKTNIGTVRSLDIEQKYGNLNIGSVNNLKGHTQYAGLTVDKLLKSVQMTVKYGNGVKFNYIGPDVDNINLSTSYTNQVYHFDNGVNLSANISSSFGNLQNKASNISLSNSSSITSATYKGKIGNGSRGSMTLTTSYGNIIFK
jgi:hypothetical protein